MFALIKHEKIFFFWWTTMGIYVYIFFCILQTKFKLARDPDLT